MKLSLHYKSIRILISNLVFDRNLKIQCLIRNMLEENLTDFEKSDIFLKVDVLNIEIIFM